MAAKAKAKPKDRGATIFIPRDLYRALTADALADDGCSISRKLRQILRIWYSPAGYWHRGQRRTDVESPERKTKKTKKAKEQS